MAATRNSNYYEVVWVHPEIPRMNAPLYSDGYQDELRAVDRDGCVVVPSGAGLGVAYDWTWIEKNRVQFREYS